MKVKEFKRAFFQWRIPKNLREVIMREMENMNLIKVEKNTVYLNDYYFNEDEFKDNFSDKDTKSQNPYIEYEKL